MRERLSFWLTMLRRSWSAAPVISTLLVVVIAAESGAVALLALGVRDLVQAAGRGDTGDLLTAATWAALSLLIVNIGTTTRQSLRGILCERIGLTVDQEIIATATGLSHLDHLERPDYLDRVSLALGSGPTLVGAAWIPLESAGAMVGLGASVVLLTQVHPALLVLVLLAPLPLLVNRRAQALIRSSALVTAEAARREEHLFGLLTSPSSVKEIMVTGASRRLLRARDREWDAVSAVLQRARFTAAALMAAGWLLFTAGYVAGLGYAAFLVADGRSTTGELLLAVTLAGQLRRQVEQTVESIGNVISGGEALDPYLWLLRHHREQHRSHTAAHEGEGPPRVLRQGITLDNVSFRYPQGARRTLDSVSVHLPAGSTVAIVGEYGSGKTTLVKLLCGLHEPADGRITVDGTDVRDFAPGVWPSRLAVAFQDFGRYRTTVRQAVGIGDLPRADDPDALRRALDDGAGHEVVDRLPEGLQALLGRDFGGTDLSEGQWQRIALSRAAMREDPLLMILDEPTAALDAPAEYEVYRRQRTIARRLAHSSGTVTLIVSHRLSTVRDADLILVMADGRIVEAGDHAVLRARGGRYAELLAIHDELHTTHRRSVQQGPAMAPPRGLRLHARRGGGHPLPTWSATWPQDQPPASAG